VAALQLLKPCDNIQQTHNYKVLLAALAPPLVATGHRAPDGRFDGLLLAFARRLRVSAGRRTRTALEKAAGVLGRPRAFLQAAMTRATTDEAALKRGAFAVGDAVLAHGQPGTLVGVHGDGSCTVEFKVGEAYEQVTYKSMRGTPTAAPEPGAAGPVRPARPSIAGSARLQHPPLTLEPEVRKLRRDAGWACVKGWGGCRCAGAARCTVAATRCSGGGASGAGCSRTWAVLVEHSALGPLSGAAFPCFTHSFT
jgi:hypothetical protein